MNEDLEIELTMEEAKKIAKESLMMRHEWTVDMALRDITKDELMELLDNETCYYIIKE